MCPQNQVSATFRGAQSPPSHWQVQLVSVIAAVAAPLPDISFSDSAAQRVDKAMATKAALLMTLRATGRWVLTISRMFAMEIVRSEHVHGVTFVKQSSVSACG